MSDPTTQYLLPPAAYTSQEWFDREQEELFERAWVFAGVEHDLPNVGDFITATVGRAPVVVVRGKDGEVRAFHNVCRHRGLAVVEGEGNCAKGMICPYHRWNYGLDGSLRAVPQREQYPQFEFSETGLLPVRCETWKTLVFVTLSEDVEPLETWMDDMGTMFQRFEPANLVEVSDQRHEVAANWKLYVENHVDWLHLWYLHEDSLGVYRHTDGERQEHGRHWTSFEALSEDVQKALDEELAGAGTSTGLLPIPDLISADKRNGAHFVFPSLTLFTNFGYWMLGQVLPVDAGHFTLRLRVFSVEGSDGPEFEKTLNTVMFEDYGVTEAIQRAAGSPAFKVGPLASEYEREIMRFHQHFLDFVTG